MKSKIISILFMLIFIIGNLTGIKNVFSCVVGSGPCHVMNIHDVYRYELC